MPFDVTRIDSRRVEKRPNYGTAQQVLEISRASNSGLLFGLRVQVADSMAHQSDRFGHFVISDHEVSDPDFEVNWRKRVKH